jgi:hypothetical protein
MDFILGDETAAHAIARFFPAIKLFVLFWNIAEMVAQHPLGSNPVVGG